jgi:hypothetical protein
VPYPAARGEVDDADARFEVDFLRKDGDGEASGRGAGGDDLFTVPSTSRPGARGGGAIDTMLEAVSGSGEVPAWATQAVQLRTGHPGTGPCKRLRGSAANG